MKMNCLRRAAAPLLICILISSTSPSVRGQQYPPPPIVKDGTAILLQNYATVPLSTKTPNNFDYSFYPPPIDMSDQLCRMNFLRSEPSNAPLASTRYWVCDLNRYLYFLDRTNRTFSVYLDFESIFPKFDNNPGFAGGLVTFQFDPDYASNGIFYTVHTENPNKGSVSEPSNPNAVLPSGYTSTGVINPPVGVVTRQAVLVEWKDTNINNATFEGTAREIVRLGFNGTIHPLGDLAFNPLAQPGDADYRNLYLSVGDGGAGETATNNSQHYIPQRLDALQGKILRITPDLNLRTSTSIVSTNGQYRIPTGGPDPNPFVNTNGARPEIFTYGHRNPHRLTWDPVSNRLFIFEIGLTSFEEVNIVHKGENYGYADREGTMQLIPPGTGYGGRPPGWGLSPLPVPDLLPIRTNGSATPFLVPVHYPVAEYFQSEGDAMSCGFIYRGTLVPQLYGKCLFGDITTGRLFYCDIADMLAADDTNPATLANVHEVQVIWDSPYDLPDQGAVRRRMFDVVAEEYAFRGGVAPFGAALPGGADVTSGLDPDGIPYGGGRADIRLAMDGDRELFVLSKSDGTIRRVTAAVVGPPVIQSTSYSNGIVNFTWQSLVGQKYRAEYTSSLEGTWTNLPGDITATGSTSSKSDTPADTIRFYRVEVIH